MKPFATKKEAEHAAVEAGLVGLTDGGQVCGPVAIDIGNGIEWIYETAHNYWGGEPIGEAVFSDEVVSRNDPRFLELFS